MFFKPLLTFFSGIFVCRVVNEQSHTECKAWNNILLAEKKKENALKNDYL